MSKKKYISEKSWDEMCIFLTNYFSKKRKIRIKKLNFYLKLFSMPVVDVIDWHDEDEKWSKLMLISKTQKWEWVARTEEDRGVVSAGM